jgi:hypothetical protein
MGASCWAYFVAYQSDVGKALQELRQEEFRKGKYYRVGVRSELIAELENTLRRPDLDPNPEIHAYLQREYRAHLKRLKSLPEPTTVEERIEELIVVNDDSGTHSIIDIHGISSTPRFGMAAPLPRSDLVDLFGTDKPTRSMVEGLQDRLVSLRSRWMGTYVVVFKDGVPDEIYFAGNSGD